MESERGAEQQKRRQRKLDDALFSFFFAHSSSSSTSHSLHFSQVIPQLGADGRKAAPDLPSFLLKERIVYLVRNDEFEFLKLATSRRLPPTTDDDLFFSSLSLSLYSLSVPFSISSKTRLQNKKPNH